MPSVVTEIATDVYRLSTFHPDFGIQFNQFLLADAEPFLMHTGMRQMFAQTRDAVAQVLDPSTVRWIGWSHFEADECGALDQWLALAPRAQVLCGVVAATINVNDAAARPPRVLADGETVSTGRHTLQFLATPQLPHGWDAGLFFDQTTRTLFCSDLFFQPGDPPPLVETDLVEPARQAIVAGADGPLAHDLPYTPRTDAMLQRLVALRPQTLAVMHGSSYRGDGAAALRGLAAVLAAALGSPPR